MAQILMKYLAQQYHLPSPYDPQFWFQQSLDYCHNPHFHSEIMVAYIILISFLLSNFPGLFDKGIPSKGVGFLFRRGGVW